MTSFSLKVRDANLAGGRGAAEPHIRKELADLSSSAVRLEGALSLYALFAENSWSDHELGARTYLAAAGAMLAMTEGAPRIETVNLLFGAVDEFQLIGDRPMALALAYLAQRIAEHTGRIELVVTANAKVKELGDQ